MGGRRAAESLRDEIKELLHALSNVSKDTRILIRIFANAMSGSSGKGSLSTTLRRTGVLKDERVFHDFLQGFSGSQNCEFIDLGPGKEKADEKIKGPCNQATLPRSADQYRGDNTDAFHHCIASPTCKHILFGGCHDGGYARLLEKHTGETAVTSRVTLIRAVQTSYEYDILKDHFAMLRLETFRPDLLNSPLAFRPSHTKSSPSQSEPAVPMSYSAKARLPLNDGEIGMLQKLGIKAKSSKLSAADRAIANRRQTEKLLGPIKQEPGSGRRIDTPLTSIMTTEQASRFRDRVNRPKLCNEWMVKGDCGMRGASEGCLYNHEAVLNDEEKVQFLLMLRKQSCKLGPLKCHNELCWYGHR